MRILVPFLATLLLVASARAQDWISRNGGSIGNRNAPRQGAQPTPTPTPPQTVADAQKEAVRRYPDLAVEGSAFNQEFLALYKRHQQDGREYFTDPAWPLHLAEEVASGGKVSFSPMGGDAKYDSASFLGLTEAQVIQRLGKPESEETYPSPSGPFKMLKYGGEHGQETFFAIFASDGKVANGQYRGVPFRSQ